MTENYIENHFDTIKRYASITEDRGDDSWCTKEMLLRDNETNLALAKKYGVPYVLIDEDYKIEI